MGEFTFLPYCIALVLFEYLLVVLLTLRCSSSPSGGAASTWGGVFELREFPSCCEGLFGRSSSLLLLLTRSCSMLFFLVVGMCLNWSREVTRGHWQYFTNWNIGLIAGYYSLASALSLYFLWQTSLGSSSLSALDSPRMRGLSTFASVYFSVASVTALFVTTVNFLLLDPTPRFYNMTAHLFTTLSFLVETSLNSIEVKKNEFVFNASWVVLWMCVIWPVVVFGVKPDWPYDFMDSSTPAVFLWFQLLFTVYFLMYMAWQRLVEWKLRKYSTLYHKLPPGYDDHKVYEGLTSEI